MAGASFVQSGIGMYSNLGGGAIDAADAAGQHYAEAETQGYNADVLLQRSQQTRIEGARNEEQHRRGYRDFAGRQLAAIGEGGLSGGGSALDIVRDSETRANLDALKIQYAATTRAESLLADSRVARFRSEMARALAQKHEKKRDGILRTWEKFHPGGESLTRGGESLTRGGKVTGSDVGRFGSAFFGGVMPGAAYKVGR